MNKKIYVLLEKVLHLNNYRDKLIFIFLINLIIALIVYSIYHTYTHFKEEIEFAQKGINNAVKIRTSFLKERLYLIRDAFETMNFDEELLNAPLINGVKHKNKLYNFPDCNVDKIFIFCKNNIIVKVHEDFFVALNTKAVDDILNPKKGMISTYNPYFKIKNRLENKKDVCSFEKLDDSDFGIEGCIDKYILKKQLISTVLMNNISLFLIFALTSYLIFRWKFQDVVLFPLYYLKSKVSSIDIENMEKIKFDLHKDIKDEFGKLSKILENMRLEVARFNKKIDLIFDTTIKMTSYTNDIYNFILFTLNEIEKIFKDIDGLLVSIYNKEDFSDLILIHSNKFLKNDISTNISNFDLLLNSFKKDNKTKYQYKIHNKTLILIKKELTDDKGIIFAVITTDELSSQDKKYLNIVFMHLVYSINLLNLANHDNLTKLFNRNAILSRINKEVEKVKRYNKKLSIILVDIDDFKRINDTYGHISGDIVLKNIANILKAQIRSSDYIGRWGGEEFLIVLPETPLERATEMAERLRTSIENHVFEINGTKIRITVSLGVASVEEHGVSVEDLIKAADIALYSAKKKGKNKVLVLSKEKIKEFINKEFIKYDELRKIFDEDKLIPFFQGVHDIKSDNLNIFGFEILARVKTKYGYLSAKDFINDFIKFGFIESLDVKIQEKALKYISENKIKNYKFFFNLSKAYIHNIKNFENFIKKCEELSVDTGQIVFEITEEEAITEINTVREIIRIAKNKNIQFALDDFGAGYSTFSYIKYFDLDYIKLDGSLVKGIANNKDNRIILEGIIHISKVKNIKTIAEWIENEEDLKVLKELGVDYAQGFLLSKPNQNIT